jgi:hypothetical protein
MPVSQLTKPKHMAQPLATCLVTSDVDISSQDARQWQRTTVDIGNARDTRIVLIAEYGLNRIDRPLPKPISDNAER